MHRKLTLEKKFLPSLLPGLELTEIISVHSKVTSVIQQTFITLHHLLSNKTAQEVYKHAVFVLATLELPRCDYRVMLIIMTS